MISTFGVPGAARTGLGHAGVDSSVVLPILPGNAEPGSYSFSAMEGPSPCADVHPTTARLSGSPHRPSRMSRAAAGSRGGRAARKTVLEGDGRRAGHRASV